jgi:hypothetical protein
MARFRVVLESIQNDPASHIRKVQIQYDGVGLMRLNELDPLRSGAHGDSPKTLPPAGSQQLAGNLVVLNEQERSLTLG